MKTIEKKNTTTKARATRKSAPRKTVSIEICAEIAEPLKAILDASGTLLTVAEYLQNAVAAEVLESFNSKRYSEGVQEFVANQFQLEPGDMERMSLAAFKWATENPKGVERIREIL